ncbi:hypothetical protein [Nocardia asteroides]|uniref:hypothetical protein n=1 Tax=Nocardia asteroides TaxID=1824 RepID=UPI003646C5BB
MTQKPARPGVRHTGAANGRQDRTQDISGYVNGVRVELSTYRDTSGIGYGYGQYVGHYNPGAAVRELHRNDMEQRVNHQIHEVLAEVDRRVDIDPEEALSWLTGAQRMLSELIEWKGLVQP